jgi:hypothetical protein
MRVGRFRVQRLRDKGKRIKEKGFIVVSYEVKRFRVQRFRNPDNIDSVVLRHYCCGVKT